MEDIKENITDNQYKIIVDSLMKIHKIKEEKLFRFITGRRNKNYKS